VISSRWFDRFDRRFSDSLRYRRDASIPSKRQDAPRDVIWDLSRQRIVIRSLPLGASPSGGSSGHTSVLPWPAAGELSCLVFIGLVGRSCLSASLVSSVYLTALHPHCTFSSHGLSVSPPVSPVHRLSRCSRLRLLLEGE